MRGELPSGLTRAGNPSGVSIPAFLLVVVGNEAAVVLLFSASILLKAIGFAPVVLAKLSASESEVSLGCTSGVLTPKIPASISLFNKNLTSLTIPDKLSENVNSVETAIFSKLSKAIPLLRDAFYAFEFDSISS